MLYSLNDNYIIAEVDFEAIYGHVDHWHISAFYGIAITYVQLAKEVNAMRQEIYGPFADYISRETTEWNVFGVVDHVEANNDRNGQLAHSNAWFTQAHIIRNAYNEERKHNESRNKM